MKSDFLRVEFNFGSFNIQGGASNKIGIKEITELINSCDLFALQETWLLPGESVKLTDYNTFKSNRKPKKKAKRGVDGVLIFYKSKYRKGISRQQSLMEKDVIWVRLDKTFFGLNRDIFVAAAYRPPRESTVGTFYSKLEKDITKYSSKGDIILIGDFNSRIGQLDQTISHIYIDELDNMNSRQLFLGDKRTSQDTTTNKKGKDFLDLCNKSQLVILNGRKLGDISGKYTCHKYNGSSVVDFIATSYNLYSKVKYFKVLEPVWFSDHCPLACSIEVRVHRNEAEIENEYSSLQELPTKYKWEEEGARLFQHKVEKTLLKEVGKLDLTTPDAVAKKYEEILINFAKESLKICKHKIPDNSNRAKWMNKECFKEQKAFKFAKNEFMGDPHNINRRQKFLNQKKKYKKLLYLTKKSVAEKDMRRIGELATKSPNLFWRNIKHLMKNTQSQTNNYISPKGWEAYFKKLLNKTKLNKLEQTRPGESGPLDFKFTSDEIIQQIKQLKTNKSASTSVVNEMLKCNPEIIAKSLVAIFNFVLKERIYPKIWNISHISPLFKAGAPTEASNYRGICVGNAIGKLFNKCINKRIEDFLRKHKTIPDNSMGFKRKIQTEHAMHTLHTVNSKYKKLNKKLYTIFIDFSKFYDTITHDLLFSKLERIGIFGNVLCLLKSMYRGLQYNIKLHYYGKYGLTEPFTANIGLKQGCPLSPTLANIFLHDIHKGLRMEDISLDNIFFNSIAWADDLVFFSLSREGINKQLAHLEKYCREWRLKVNIDKTKCIIFSSTNVAYDRTDNFIFNGDIINFVSYYKYLGIEFQQNGKFTLAIENRIAKANAALFAIKRLCSSGNFEYPSNEMLMTLFKAKIIPILTYGSSVWGPKSNNTVCGKRNSNFKSTESLMKHLELLNIKPKIVKTNEEVIKITLDNFSAKQKLLAVSNRLGMDVVVSPYNELNTIHQNIERFYLSFMKTTLGVKKSCPSDNIRFELGAYPIFTKIIPKALKFYTTMKDCSYNNLIRASFVTSKSIRNCWGQGIHFFLNQIGLQGLWNGNSTLSSLAINRISKRSCRNLHIDFLKQNTSHKFDFLRREMIDEYKMRPYLKKIINPKYRSTLTKLRTHSHCLLEETHSFLETAPTCTNCNSGKNETPFHFLLECSNEVLASLRSSYIERLGINESNTQEYFTRLMRGQIDSKDINTVYKTINAMYTKRQTNELTNT